MGQPEPASRVGFAECYQATRTDLVRSAFLLSGSRELAEDVVQTVFVDAQLRWERIEHPGAYVRRAVVNQVRDAQRRSFRARRYVPQRDVSVGIPELDQTWDQIVRLPARQREVVVLRFYEDLAFGEIAAVLDRNPATVRSDLHRAIGRLRKDLHV